MRIALRYYLLDAQDTVYHVPNAVIARLLDDRAKHRLPRFAGQRARSAEIAVALLNGKPIAVERSSFSMVRFDPEGALLSPLADPHVRARAELALSVEPRVRAEVEDAGNRFLARGGQWSPTPAIRRRIEQAALGRLKCRRA